MVEKKSITEIPLPNDMLREPHRPLGELSNFVATELPDCISQKKDQLPALADELAHNVDLDGIDTESATVHLDIMMLVGAIERNEMEIGPELLALDRELGIRSGKPRVLSYEDVIIGNPHDTDPRTYTDGVIGASEVFFYRIHLVIEEILGHAVQKLEAAIIELDQLRETIVNQVLPAMKEVNFEMDRMHEELDGNHFMGFRHYFSVRNVDGLSLAGASGKFSPGILALDTLGFGNDPKLRTRIAKKKLELNLYPQTSVTRHGIVGIGDIVRAQTYADAGRTLLDHAHAMGDAELSEASMELAREMKRFRTFHFKLVGKFLRDVMVGTAGEVITPFLRSFLEPFQALTR